MLVFNSSKNFVSCSPSFWRQNLQGLQGTPSPIPWEPWRFCVWMLLVACVLGIWMSSSLFIRCKKNNCELWIVNCKFIITFAHSRAYTLNHLCGLSWQGGDNIMERYVSCLGLSWNRNNLLTNKTNCLWSKTTERTLMMRVWWRDSVTALQIKLIKLKLLT